MTNNSLLELNRSIKGDIASMTNNSLLELNRSIKGDTLLQ